ncbi:hypothetical protein E2C01_046862 [Portunus trituberculatus]|uniref:Uncharacterized protein n=1 Tax=Portunus trituberculatus TaxID=210409 RepID=A0A5B7FYW2_PORTR|nr:hypothetical protein [Portunus trituberculatus]
MQRSEGTAAKKWVRLTDRQTRSRSPGQQQHRVTCVLVSGTHSTTARPVCRGLLKLWLGTLWVGRGTSAVHGRGP